jgi:DNA polymerase elongation subunit (family B)
MIAGVKLEETLMNSRVIESIIMRAGIKPMPTKGYNKVVTESFEGALVMVPPVGLHENVGCIDATALYPNIIVGFDVSPDVDHIIPKTIKTIMEERDVLRAIRLEGKGTEVMKNKETVLKYLANSFYGVIGWPKFRLYNVEQAAFITKTGREINEFLQGRVKEYNLTPIYGDTDSIFVKGIRDVSHGIEIQDRCNRDLGEWSRRRGSSVAFTVCS